MEALDSHHINIPPSAASSSAARAIVATAARRMTCMADADIEDLCVAVGEAFANVVRHGACEGDEVVHIRVEHGGDRLQVHLSYRGEPFNTMPTPPAPEDLAGGGYGLFIMRTLADVVEFTFRDGMTHLCLEKRCNPLGAVPGSETAAWTTALDKFPL